VATRWARLQLLARPRRPEALPQRLDRHRIYVLPTRFGLFVAVLLAAMLLGALNYNNNPALLLALPVLMTACGGGKATRPAPPPPTANWPKTVPDNPEAANSVLMRAISLVGTPYRYGGNTPDSGFDCSGLVYYAYKDLVKFRIPRTANEMYHLRDASPVDRGELESGDLVFFRTQGRGTADHVGVYVGNGKFIQSPRTGQDIQITSLSEDYWQRHYVGARRVMKANTLR